MNGLCALQAPDGALKAGPASSPPVTTMHMNASSSWSRPLECLLSPPPPPPLQVLIIGYGATMAAWGPTLLARLAAQREVIIFDPPAQGLSTEAQPGNNSITPAAFAEASADGAPAARSCWGRSGALSRLWAQCPVLPARCPSCRMPLASTCQMHHQSVGVQGLSLPRSLSAFFSAHGPSRVCHAPPQATLALLDALNLTRPHIAGLSLGACVALKIAADHPERVGKVLAPVSLAVAHTSDVLALSSAQPRHRAALQCGAQHTVRPRHATSPRLGSSALASRQLPMIKVVPFRPSCAGHIMGWHQPRWPRCGRHLFHNACASIMLCRRLQRQRPGWLFQRRRGGMGAGSLALCPCFVTPCISSHVGL